ncbi:non-canonical purine NTP diphosphatase [Flagellimonas sp. HMM57]|uniref:non-canonical purine NTP diphosphatase n=1 Tax=unclassified Flagellimonas TaxID=2644544 RepID=UPI0013D665CC|nr:MULTISPECIES: non-canonical purine NTP diphosphatase [unclassified Flagellimonas]UII75540.1 non-canonical purine NTP diphosphatase [Flagellimonas sp. HMM57]
MKIVFATHNQHKLEEVRELLPSFVELLSLTDIGCLEEIPETGKTLEENAKIKADYVTSTFGQNCFSDDTGLLIDALHGAPGVFSARYAGTHKSTRDNIAKVLREMESTNNREAHFKTVVHLNLNNKSYAFEGIVEGNITKKEYGTGGFGYDPIFRPETYDATFGELSPEIKNAISHRGRAIRKLVAFFEKMKP